MKIIQLDDSSTETLLEVIENKWHLFSNIDRTFSIEKAVCKALLGQSGLAPMEDRIMKVLPAEGRLTNIDACMRGMQAIGIA
jgi:hypothetical protein